MITGETPSGFEFEVNENVINDWRFVKAIAKAESDNPKEKLIGLTKLCELMLGEDGENRLMEKIASENDGNIPQELIYKDVVDIINFLKERNEEIKKSSSSQA